MMTPQHFLVFKPLPCEGGYSVVQLAADAPVPAWVRALPGEGLCSITRTRDELSVVCPTSLVPVDDVAVRAHERGWAALAIDMGALPFGLTGVLLAALAPLAKAGIGIFALSTFNTDVVLVKQDALAAAIDALRQDGHTVNA